MDTIYPFPRIDVYSRCGFAFPACQPSSSTIIQAHIECLILQPKIPHTTVSHKGTHLTLKKCWNRHNTVRSIQHSTTEAARKPSPSELASTPLRDDLPLLLCPFAHTPPTLQRPRLAASPSSHLPFRTCSRVPPVLNFVLLQHGVPLRGHTSLTWPDIGVPVFPTPPDLGGWSRG